MRDDIGWDNTRTYNRSNMSYKTPDLDRIGKVVALPLLVQPRWCAS